MESIDRIMIRAEVFWQALPATRSLEHAGQCRTIHNAAVNAKPNDAAGKLVHRKRQTNPCQLWRDCAHRAGVSSAT